MHYGYKVEPRRPELCQPCVDLYGLEAVMSAQDEAGGRKNAITKHATPWTPGRRVADWLFRAPVWPGRHTFYPWDVIV